MLACFFYLIGMEGETLPNGVQVDGWVASQEDWYIQPSTNETGGVVQPAYLTDSDAPKTSPLIGTGHRYVTSLYYVLNALESGATFAERLYAVLAELIRDMILGLVASLMTTISMSMASNDNENSFRLKRLKLWLQRKRASLPSRLICFLRIMRWMPMGWILFFLRIVRMFTVPAPAGMPKGFQDRMMQHFNEVWNNQSDVDLNEMVDNMPPAMASALSEFLYGRFLGTVPLFKGLSKEVVAGLCAKVKPMNAMKNQNIIKQGESGKEMYMVMSGEVEVIENDVRLGFLSEGAFFGEAPVLGMGESGTEIRRRTVRAVTETELCFLSRGAVSELCDDYPELEARLKRFTQSGMGLNAKRLMKAGLTRTDLKTFSSDCEPPTGPLPVHPSASRKSHRANWLWHRSPQVAASLQGAQGEGPGRQCLRARKLDDGQHPDGSESRC